MHQQNEHGVPTLLGGIVGIMGISLELAIYVFACLSPQPHSILSLCHI